MSFSVLLSEDPPTSLVSPGTTNSIVKISRPPPGDSTKKRCHHGGTHAYPSAVFQSTPLRLVCFEGCRHPQGFSVFFFLLCACSYIYAVDTRHRGLLSTRYVVLRKQPTVHAHASLVDVFRTLQLCFGRNPRGVFSPGLFLFF